MRSALGLVVLVACGGDGTGVPGLVDAATPEPIDAATAEPIDAAAQLDAPPIDAAPACRPIDGTLAVATAGAAGEAALTVHAAATSATRWSEVGNEAVILEVLAADRFVGHLVLHQGARDFAYAMHVGRLEAGETLSLRVSPLSAAPGACVTSATLAASDDGEAPIFRWPVQKRFDDLPVVVGYSAATQTYQAVYTSENGGTVVSCGGGSEGMQAEIARWGRGADVENVYTRGQSWGRCTGRTDLSDVAPPREGTHPIFYYGDGHNRLYESRAGYAKACGGGAAEKADGNLDGWNVGDGSDEDSTITLRPLPVDLDALGYDRFPGRREALLDAAAPWVYRLTWLELEREGKLDGAKVRPLDEYLYVDVHAADVDGSGDRECSLNVSKGFVVRVGFSDGTTLDGPQMTASYFGADEDVKRIAVPLDRARSVGEITSLVFDAYDKDGMYLLGLGPVFVVRPDGDNGAAIERVLPGEQIIGVYVDDDESGCVNDQNPDGPAPPYTCVGSDHAFTP